MSLAIPWLSSALVLVPEIVTCRGRAATAASAGSRAMVYQHFNKSSPHRLPHRPVQDPKVRSPMLPSVGFYSGHTDGLLLSLLRLAGSELCKVRVVDV